MLLLITLLTGCDHSFVSKKFDDNLKQHICRMHSDFLTTSKYCFRSQFGAQILADSSVSAWIYFEPKDTMHIPSKEISLIFKIHTLNKGSKDISLKADHYRLNDLLLKSVQGKLDSESSKIAYDVWGLKSKTALRRLLFNSEDHAAYFKTTPELLKKLAKASHVEIFIQTPNEPLKITIEKKHIAVFQEFERKCLDAL